MSRTTENPQSAAEGSKGSADQSSADFTRAVQSSVVKVIRDANGLPKRSKGFELFSSYPAYVKFMKEQQSRVLLTLRRLLHSSGCRVRVPKKVEDLDDFLERLVEANDSIAERVGIALDVLSKRKSEAATVSMDLGAEATKSAPADVFDRSRSLNRYSILLSRQPGFKSSASSPASQFVDSPSASHVATKPQIEYGITVDNSYEPFVSKLKVKHHSRCVPTSNLHIRDEDSGRNDHTVEWNAEQYTGVHPYQQELDFFEIPERQLERGEVAELKSLEETDFVCVDSVEKLHNLISILNSSEEFAVDLEHHSYRSYLGLTCLLQISTRTTDYVVDPFPIWNDMRLLNEPFTDPKILKVFHGAEYDVEWLQRDFGIYLVNMFDTHKAMKILDFEKFSLLHLVHQCCHVALNKELQKCDWRLRPLSLAHLEYARGDTHYLLHCYDQLRVRLFDSTCEGGSQLRSAYIDSKMVCLNVYEKPQFESDGYEVLLRGRKQPNGQQQFAFAGLWKWRDDRARNDDESCEYVLPNHMLIQIAEVLPREMQGILACCSPVPPLVKQELLTLHRIVYAARDCPIEKRFTSQAHVNTTSFAELFSRLRRATKTNALINSHLDFTSTKFDEEVRYAGSPTIVTRVVADSTEAPQSVRRKGANFFPNLPIYLIGKADGKELAAKAGALRETANDWATPFECYRISLRQEQEKLAEEARKAAESCEKTPSAMDATKKRWSHHDPSAVTLTHIEKKVEGVVLELERKERVEVGIGLDPDAVLTKKALKKKRKMERKHADIPYAGAEGATSAREGGPTPEKKAKKKNWTDASEEPTQTVDYEQYNGEMFKEKPQRQDVYDPFGRGASNIKKKGSKFGRGFGRGGGAFSNKRGRGHSQRGH